MLLLGPGQIVLSLGGKAPLQDFPKKFRTYVSVKVWSKRWSALRREAVGRRNYNARPPAEPAAHVGLVLEETTSSIPSLLVVRTNIEACGTLRVVPALSWKGVLMDKDRIKSTAQQAKGAIKETVGEVTGDAKLKSEGKSEKVAGKVQPR